MTKINQKSFLLSIFITFLSSNSFAQEKEIKEDYSFNIDPQLSFKLNNFNSNKDNVKNESKNTTTIIDTKNKTLLEVSPDENFESPNKILLQHEISIYLLEKEKKQLVYKNVILNKNSNLIDLFLFAHKKDKYSTDSQNAIVNNISLSGQKNQILGSNQIDNIKFNTYVLKNKKQLLTHFMFISDTNNTNKSSTNINSSLSNKMKDDILHNSMFLNTNEDKEEQKLKPTNLIENKPNETNENMEITIPHTNNYDFNFVVNNLYIEMKSVIIPNLKK